jgi:uncharacterized protein (DUF885 family)
MILALGLAPAVSLAVTPSELEQTVQAYDRLSSVQDPIRAGMRGDAAALARWPDDSPRQVTARVKELERLRSALGTPPQGLDDEQALTRDLLLERIDTAIEGARFDEERIPFQSGEGFYTLPESTAATTPIRGDADARAWLARLKAIPGYYTIEIANMRRGIATRFTQPRVTVETAVKTVGGLAAEAPEKSALLLPFSRPGNGMEPKHVNELREEAIGVIRETVRPAQRALLDFFSKEYLPKARPALGVRTVPGGEAYYRYLVRFHTTTTLSPDEVYALGEREVARIHEEMDALRREAGFTGTVPQFIASLREDKRFYAEDAEDLREKVSEILKRADYLLPLWFKTLPRLTYGVIWKPAGLESISSGYLPGSPEQGQAGALVLDGASAPRNPLYSLPSWAFHEGVPGHHLQIALAQERADLPQFRRNDDITAFVEGWALYTEKLAEEMGLYRNLYERFGRLSMEMWRACRLVMDTGIHWKGWSYEQAAACLRDNTGLSDYSIEGETKRYIGWPGQALAYKIGELEILRIRRRAQEVLGPRFDIREFHDRLLDDGPMPLHTLSQRMDAWVRDADARRQ